jgi:hypothetical protein
MGGLPVYSFTYLLYLNSKFLIYFKKIRPNEIFNAARWPNRGMFVANTALWPKSWHLCGK